MTTSETSERRSQPDTTQQKQRFKLSLQQKNWVLAFQLALLHYGLEPFSVCF